MHSMHCYHTDFIIGTLDIQEQDFNVLTAPVFIKMTTWRFWREESGTSTKANSDREKDRQKGGQADRQKDKATLDIIKY